MKKINKKGFTLIELIAVIILLIVIITIALINYMPTLENGKKNALVDEAKVFSKGAINKYSTDRLRDDFTGEVYQGKVNGKRCYNIKSLIGRYVDKPDQEYYGSVEVCDNDNVSCDYKSKVWLSNGQYYINGEIIDDSLTIEDVTEIKGTEYFETCGIDVTNISNEYLYDYTGQEEVFVAPVDGTYSIEVWGAEGGGAFAYAASYTCGAGTFYNGVRVMRGGYGGSAYTEIDLKQGDKLYINVGEKGRFQIYTSADDFSASYNGGGTNSSTHAGGGGATTVSFKSGLIKNQNPTDIIAVAGGGGGAYANGICNTGHGGNAGGYCSEGGSNSRTCSYDSNATYGEFDPSTVGTGGGFYTGPGRWNGTSGGTGFIGNPMNKNAVMYCYGTSDRVCSSFTEAYRKTEITTNYSEEPISGYAKLGNGYAKITKLT